MGTTNTAATLTSYVKEVYPSGIGQVIPRKTMSLDTMKYKNDLEIGQKAKIPIQVTDEHGFSYKDGPGTIALAAAVAHEGVHLEVGPYQLALRIRISYDLAAQASSSKKAFAVWNEKRFIPAIESAQKRLNVLATYGRDSLAEVESVSTNDIVIKAGSWAPWIWLGAKGAPIDIFSAKTAGTQRNTGALTIAGINSSTRTITVSGTHSGVAPGDFLFYFQARGQEQFGIFGAAKQSLVGSIYNLNHSTYEALQANYYLVTGRLTIGQLLEAAAYSMDKGCDEKLAVQIPSTCFANMVNDQSALRSHGAEMKLRNGAKSLEFSLGDVELEIMPSGVVKRGEFIMYPERYTHRIGSTDWTNTLPGTDSEELVLHVPDATEYEMRFYTAQTVVPEKMSWVTYGSRADGGIL